MGTIAAKERHSDLFQGLRQRAGNCLQSRLAAVGMCTTHKGLVNEEILAFIET